MNFEDSNLNSFHLFENKLSFEKWIFINLEINLVFRAWFELGEITRIIHSDTNRWNKIRLEYLFVIFSREFNPLVPTIATVVFLPFWGSIVRGIEAVETNSYGWNFEPTILHNLIFLRKLKLKKIISYEQKWRRCAVPKAWLWFKKCAKFD